MAEYFIRRKGKTHGPVSGQQLVEAAKSSKLKPTDEVATRADGPWKAATKFKALNTVFGELADFDSLPPKKTENVSPANIPPEADVTTGGPSSSVNTVTPPDKPQPKTMACPDCDGTVSRRAQSCPHCGAPLASGPPTGTTAVQPVNVIDNEEALKNPVIIQTFDTKGKLTTIDGNKNLYEDEAECRIKFNATGEYQLVAGPVVCDERGFEYFLHDEHGVNCVHGTAGEAYTAKVDFYHRNWSGLTVKVKAFQNVGDIPICQRPDSELTLTYAGLAPGVNAGLIKASVRLVIANGIQAIKGEMVKVDAVSSLRWRDGVNGVIACKVQLGDEFIELGGAKMPSPLPAKRCINCTSLGGLFGQTSFSISKVEIDESHPNVTEVDGEYRFANLKILSGR